MSDRRQSDNANRENPATSDRDLSDRVLPLLRDTIVQAERSGSADVMPVLCSNLRRLTGAWWTAIVSFNFADSPVRIRLEAVEGITQDVAEALGAEGEVPASKIEQMTTEEVRECREGDKCVLEYLERCESFFPRIETAPRYRVSCVEDGRIAAAAVIQMPDGARIAEIGAVSLYVKTAAMILKLVRAARNFEKREAEMRDMQADLEKRVEERTRALLESNMNLKAEIERRNRVEKQLQGSEEQLRQALKMEALGRLAGGVAHDFNNLLMSILGFSKLVRDDLGQDNPLRKDVDKIIYAGERAAELTRRLLAVGRKQIVEPGPLEVNQVVRNVHKLLRRTIGEDVELVTVLEEKPTWINGDAGQIEQVVMNLAINGRDAMSSGGKLTIRTTRVPIDDETAAAKVMIVPGEYVLLSVADEGSGISKEHKSLVFEPFFTTKGQGKGSGLGLSAVYAVVQQHKGGIEFDTEAGKGTEFRVYLPALTQSFKNVENVRQTSIVGGAECILLVEDEHIVRDLASRLLRSLGYRVIDASDGTAALEASRLHADKIDLVLTDMVMPIMGGTRLAAELKAQRPEIKALFMTGFSDEVTRPVGDGPQRAMLVKPFDKRTLAAKVREVLDSK